MKALAGFLVRTACIVNQSDNFSIGEAEKKAQRIGENEFGIESLLRPAIRLRGWRGDEGR